MDHRQRVRQHRSSKAAGCRSAARVARGSGGRLRCAQQVAIVDHQLQLINRLQHGLQPLPAIALKANDALYSRDFQDDANLENLADVFFHQAWDQVTRLGATLDQSFSLEPGERLAQRHAIHAQLASPGRLAQPLAGSHLLQNEQPAEQLVSAVGAARWRKIRRLTGRSFSYNFCLHIWAKYVNAHDDQLAECSAGSGSPGGCFASFSNAPVGRRIDRLGHPGARNRLAVRARRERGGNGHGFGDPAPITRRATRNGRARVPDGQKAWRHADQRGCRGDRRVAIELARHAQQSGASALVAIPPISVALGEQELLDYFRLILNAVTIPLVVQDASGYVGRPIPPSTQVRLLDEYGPERVYFKPEAAPLGPNLSRLHTLSAGRARVLEGSGGVALVNCFRRGIVGTMPGADLIDAVVALWQALSEGDERRTYQLSLPLSALVGLQTGLDGFLAVEKYLLKRQGVFINTVVRGPVSYRLDDETRQEVDRLFDLLTQALQSAAGGGRGVSSGMIRAAALMFTLLWAVGSWQLAGAALPESSRVTRPERCLAELRRACRRNRDGSNAGAGEALVALGYSQEVGATFQRELEEYGEQPQYRVGISRIVARAGTDDQQRRSCERKIRDAALDDDGIDQVGALEALAKLHFRWRRATEHTSSKLPATAPEVLRPTRVGCWRRNRQAIRP